MGITAEKFFENIYSVIFSPKTFFEEENLNISVRLAFFVVVFIGAFNKVAFAIAEKTILDWLFCFFLVFSIIGTVFVWLIFALYMEYVAKIFDYSGHLSKILYLSAFSSIPMVFFAPINLLKNLGEFGYIISAILGCFLYLWIVILYAFAIKNTYKLTLARSFMFIFLPIISSILLIYQTAGFYRNMWYIFSL